MENQSISRAHYYERQFLRTPDFRDEQAYHLGMLRRHQVTEHIWGIVRGLELMLSPDGVPMLLAGIAVDGFGRTLVWQAQQTLPVSEFDAKGSNTLHVWLAYDELETDSALQGFNGCLTDNDSEAYDRIQEQPALRLAIPDSTHPNPRIPPGVDEDNPEFDPTQNPPQSPSVQWPVYLGRVVRKREKPNKPWTYSVSMDGRPYAGLVGEMVIHPTENAWVEIGTPAGEDGKDTRFAVFLNTPKPENTPNPQQDLPVQSEIDPDPRLEITAQGQINLRGDATLNGSLTLEAGALILKAQDSHPIPDTSQPWPWMLYRAAGSVKEVKAESEYTAEEQAEVAAAKAAGQPIPKFFKDIMTSDLRLEMAGKGSGTHCVVVGAWAKGADGKEAFQPCLTVDDNCNVIVEKNLIIKGFISQMQGGGPYTVTPEVRSMMLGAYASQATGIAGQVQQLFAGAGNITPEMLLKLLESTEGRLAVLDTLFSDQNLRDDFIVALLNHPNNSLTGQQAVLVILRGDAARAKAVADWFMADDTSRALLATTLLGAANGQDTLAKTLIANLPDLDSLLGGVLIDSNALKTTLTKMLGKPNGIAAGPGALADWLADAANVDSLKSVVSELSNVTNGPDQFWKAATDTPTVVGNFMGRLVDPANSSSLNAVAGELGKSASSANAFWDAVWAAATQNTLIAALLDPALPSLKTTVDAVLDSQTALEALTDELNDPNKGAGWTTALVAALRHTLVTPAERQAFANALTAP